ncbi:MAG: CvpA family protein [Thermoguttaceae bacterium]
MSDSQLFDIIALVLLCGLFLRGIMRGMIAQLASLASLVISWIAASKFNGVISPYITAEPPLNKVVAMLIIFAAVTITIWLLQNLISNVISAIRLKKYDRLCGGVLGVVKGVFFCLIITFFCVVLSKRSCDAVINSQSGRYFVHGIEKISLFLPDDVGELVKKNLELFRDTVAAAFSPENRKLLDTKMLGNGMLDNEFVGQLAGVASKSMTAEKISPVIPLDNLVAPQTYVTPVVERKIALVEPIPVSEPTLSNKKNASNAKTDSTDSNRPKVIPFSRSWR